MVFRSAGCGNQVGQPVPHLDLLVDRRRIEIMKHREIKAECGNPCRLIIRFNPRNLLFQYAFQLIKCERQFLLMPFISNNASEGFHQKNAGSAGRVHYTWRILKYIGSQNTGEDKLRQNGRCVVGSVLPHSFLLFIITY